MSFGPRRAGANEINVIWTTPLTLLWGRLLGTSAWITPQHVKKFRLPKRPFETDKFGLPKRPFETDKFGLLKRPFETDKIGLPKRPFESDKFGHPKRASYAIL